MTSLATKTAGLTVALALVASAANAQDAAAPAAPAPDAASAPADPAAAPADPAPAAAPADPAAAPAAPPENQVAAPAEPPPVLPTAGDGAVITTLLEKVCKPMVAGGNFNNLVKAAGMKKVRRSEDWAIPLSNEKRSPYEVVILSPGANKNVCQLTVRYAPGYDDPILQGLNVWRFLHDPQLHAQRRDIANYSDVQRVTSTWDNWENQQIDGKIIGLVFVQHNKLDGTPSVTPTWDEAVIKYSIRPIDPNAVGSSAAPTAAVPAQGAPGV